VDMFSEVKYCFGRSKLLL